MKHPLKGVCFVAPNLDRIGGYELATLALVRSLRARAISVLVVTIMTTDLKSTAVPDLVRIDARGRLSLIRAFSQLLAFLARNRTRFSVIHCPTFDYVGGLTVLAGRILRRPTLVRVATQKDVTEFSDSRHWKRRLFFRLLSAAAGVIAPSAAIRDELLKAGFSNRGVFMVPNAVDVERFRPATLFERMDVKKTLNLEADIPVIGTVARLVQRKGIDVVLKAFQTVLHSHRAHLLVVGDGPLLDKLHLLSRELGIEASVSWLALQADTSKWLRAMDIFAFPSRLEGSPNVVLEAMAAGLPIVATRIDGIVDLIEEGKTGLLVNSEAPKELANALVQLLTDSNCRANLALQARDSAVKYFSSTNVTARLLDIYASVQNNSRRN